MSYRSVYVYRKFFERKSKRLFISREEVYDYLEHDVFIKKEFQLHISETSKTMNVSYLLAYDIITNYLTDILYELDKAVSARRKRTRISIHSYFSLRVGFMESVRNKKMFLKDLIKL